MSIHAYIRKKNASDSKTSLVHINVSSTESGEIKSFIFFDRFGVFL